MFQEEVKALGATMGNTLASTAMNVFRQVYLTEEYLTPFEYRNNYTRSGFYGGRVENFVRGWWSGVKVVDINSAYPFVMKTGQFPHPNHLRGPTEDISLHEIMSYEGVADVEIEVPRMYIPPLPFRHSDRLIFPYGIFRGHYTFVELRKLLEVGGRIRQIYSGIYSTQVCNPFIRYVEDLYNRRMEHKKSGSPYEITYKYLLNGLYGKFAQRSDTGLKKLRPLTEEDNDLPEGSIIYDIGDMEFIAEDVTYPQPCYVNVLWGAYITAYLRLRIFDLLSQYQEVVVYVDTDGFHSLDTVQPTEVLGGLKIEVEATKGLYVAPKEYLLMGEDNKPITSKAKGVKEDARPAYLLDGRGAFWRPVGLREAFVRHLAPSTWIQVVKERRENLPHRKFPASKVYVDKPVKSEPWEVNEFISRLQKFRPSPVPDSV